MSKKINNLLRYDFNKKWLIFDTETEGLNLHSTRPWQLSYCVFKGNKMVEKHNKFLKWDDLNVSEGAAKVTNFSMKNYLKKAEDPCEIMKHFNSLLYDDDYYISGANLIGFDIFVIANCHRLLGMPIDYSYIERIFDIQNIEKAIELNYQKPDSQSQTAWNFKLKSFRRKGLKTNVEYLSKKYSIEYDRNNAHDALYDINLTWQILKKQLFFINQ
jgi:DNA polymerase III epsilon subunit-like protein